MMDGGRPELGAPNARFLRSAPAVQALLIQVISFLIVLAIAHGMPMLTNRQLSIGAAAILQGAISAAVTRWRGMAPWWMPIQLLFPVGVLAVHAMHLPAWLFLAAFLVLLTIFWTTFRTQVPYYPSSPATWGAVAALLPQGRALRCIDIGSGFGGLLLRLAALRPESDFIGIELAPLPWLISVLRARAGRSTARFIRGDYEGLHFGEYDVVFAYLSPAAMPSLWRKARAEMRPGTLLLSCEFVIPGVEQDFVERTSGRGPLLYGWRL